MNILIIGNVTSIHTAKFANDLMKNHNVYILSSRDTNNLESYNESIIFIKYLSCLSNLFSLLFGRKIFNYNSETESFVHPMNLLILIRHVYLLFFINYLVKDLSFDGIIALNISTNGLYASQIKKKIKKIGITLGTDINIHKFPNPTWFTDNKRVSNYVFKKLDYIITADNEVAEPFFRRLKTYHINKNKLLYWGHFGININKFKPKDKRKLIEKYHYLKINESSIVASCFRPPRPILDFENIIIAISKIIKKNYNFIFLLGTGGRNVDYLKSLVEDLNVKNNIIFLDDINYSDLPDYINLSDIFIDPANVKKCPRIYNSGVSSALLESMACGLIPVVPNRPSIDWIIPEESKKFIFEDFEVDLAEKLELAIKERHNQKIKKAVREVVADKCNWDVNINYIINLLKS